MSDKNTNKQFDDGLEELMNAFIGYDEKGPDDGEIDLDMESKPASDDDKITLPEIPYEEISLPEIDRTSLYEYDEYAGYDGSFDPHEEQEDLIEEEPQKTEPEKPKEDGKDNKKPKKDKKIKDKKPERVKTSANKADPKKDKSVMSKAAKLEPDNSEAEQKPVSSIRLVAVLTVICAAVALLLATVNHFTEVKIAENNEMATLVSIREIFDGSVQAELMPLPEDSELTSVYLVMKNGDICGYAASVEPNGFGGPIKLMVGIDSAGTVVGVDIVSMSETPGLGSRVGNGDFLSRFKGAVGNVSVDAISGATISSKAVMSGVNTVTADLLDLYAIAAERGVSVVPYNDGVDSSPVTEEPTTETEAPATEEPVTEPPVTVAPVTEQAPPEVSKGDTPPQNIVDNPNDVNEGIHAEYEEDTAEYETLTTEPETTDPEETADD